jgi:1-acyl-sn-glycerol-3-phosphate acyltransferase
MSSVTAQNTLKAAPVTGRWLRTPIAAWRLMRSVLHILWGVAQVLTIWSRLDAPKRRERHLDWSMKMVRHLGVALEVRGSPHPSAKLVVGNHVSWLDIIAINSVMPSRFVSKAEVANWPVVGRLVTAAGTLYLVRERRRDAMRVLGIMAQALRDGDTVAVFPEGTTGPGGHIMPFHANLLQAAIDAPAPIQPVVIAYRERGHTVSPSAAYVGETGLLESLWMTVTARQLVVRVDFLDARTVAHADRRMLADQLHQDMSTALQRTICENPQT